MTNYPLSFKAKTSTDINSLKWISNSKYDIEVGIPKEFGGVDCLAPEDLYLLAALNCFIATFKVVSKNSNFEFDNIEVDSELIMDKDETNVPIMKEIKLIINISTSLDEDKAIKVIEKTLRSCYIHRSIKTVVSYSLKLV